MNDDMISRIEAFRKHVRSVASNSQFVHHKWFVKWHLEIVEHIARDLLRYHPEANPELVEVMVWLHDYGKIFDYDNQYQTTLTAGRKKLTELGFPPEFVDAAVQGIELLDKKMEVDLTQAPIAVQIVSSADGCSHMVGPFMYIFWHEGTDPTFKNKTYEELMALNLKKLEKDWTRKIVLPEARAAFEIHYQLLREQAGQLPPKYL